MLEQILSLMPTLQQKEDYVIYIYALLEYTHCIRDIYYTRNSIY